MEKKLKNSLNIFNFLSILLLVMMFASFILTMYGGYISSQEPTNLGLHVIVYAAGLVQGLLFLFVFKSSRSIRRFYTLLLKRTEDVSVNELLPSSITALSGINILVVVIMIGYIFDILIFL